MGSPSARSSILTTTALALAVLSAVAALAADQSVPAKVVDVSLFKNGLGFLIREVNVPGPGDYVLDNLPVPVHGTFWILPDKAETVLKQAVAFSKPREETSPALTLLDLLRANVGKKVDIKTEGEGWIKATVSHVPQWEPTLPIPLSEAGGRSGSSYYWDSRAYHAPTAESIRSNEVAGFVLFRTDQGMLALSPAEIKGLRSDQGDLSLDTPRPRPGAALRLTVGGAGGRLRIACLEWGLTWAPSYLVDVSDPKEASIQCKGEIINDVENLAGVKAEFVTGFPNLAFSEVVDPLALMGDLSDFVQSLMVMGQASGRRREAPAMMQQAVMSNVGGLSSADILRAGVLTPSEGEAREELFLYPQPDVTLARGQRGYYPVFAKRVPYNDLYRWQIGDSVDDQGRWYYSPWYSQPERRPDAQPPEIWHMLRLTNAGGIPWTTAPAMTVQEGRVLAQDTLYYTSPGARTLLKVTRAADVGADTQETEVTRQRDARTWYGGHYDLVTVRGELRLRNRKSKPITMLIEKTLSGDVVQSTPEAAVETSVEGALHVNPKRQLTWEVPLEAGGKASVVYQYKVYVPS